MPNKTRLSILISLSLARFIGQINKFKFRFHGHLLEQLLIAYFFTVFYIICCHILGRPKQYDDDDD